MRKKWWQKILLVWLVLLSLNRFVENRNVKVLAGDEACPAEYPYCYDYTIVNQWACEVCQYQMEWICSNSSSGNIISCDNNGEPDQSICNNYGSNVWCYQECVNGGTIESGEGCSVLQLNVQCDTSEGYCRWQGSLTNCLWEGGNCSEPSQTETKSCCGCPNPPCGDDGGGGSPTPPPACTATYPTSVVATSPADGAEVTTTTVTLSWNGPSDWGTGCPSNDNE